MNDYNEDSKERTPQEWQSYWQKEISAAKKWFQKWHAGAMKIEAEYMAKSTSIEDTNDMSRFNIFWANVEVLLSAVYAKLPDPEVDRTHLDQNDDVARVAASILERIFMFELKNLEETPDNAYRDAIKDRFIAGLGQVWPRYEFSEEEVVVDAIIDPTTGMETAPEVRETLITDEAVPLDYVRWEDFMYSPCRTWEVRRWVSRRVYMPKDKCLSRFGKIISDQISYKAAPKTLSMDDPFKLSTEPVAEIFEIWCKDHQAVFWFSTGCPVILDIKPDPLGLSGFFPAKRPLVATTVTSAFIPRPDYAMVQDQYAELNLLSTRMKLLTEALKVVGVYDKRSEEVKRMLDQANMNKLIPVDNWAMFAEKGGIKGAIDWLPLDMVVTALDKMTIRKQGLLQEIYEILGLSDIMRGQSVASETATAQQLKAQYGSARMQRVQTSIADFVTQNTRTRAEIICKHWSPQTIADRAQVAAMLPADQQYVPQAIQLLKSSSQMALRLTIQADMIAAPDWNSEKQERIDFLQAISQFIGMSMPMIQQYPGSGPFLIQMLQWAATGFRAGKQIEGVMDQALNALQMSMANPPPPPPATPQEQKDKASARKSMAEADKTNVETANMQVTGTTEPGVQKPPGEGGPGRPPETALPAGEDRFVKLHSETMEALRGVVNLLQKPKRIIRDKTGRAIGTETVQ